MASTSARIRRGLGTGLGDACVRHAGAHAAPALQDTVLGKLAHRAVDGGAGAAQFGGKLVFGGDQLAGHPFARADAAQDFGLHGLPGIQHLPTGGPKVRFGQGRFTFCEQHGFK